MYDISSRSSSFKCTKEPSKYNEIYSDFNECKTSVCYPSRVKKSTFTSAGSTKFYINHSKTKKPSPSHSFIRPSKTSSFIKPSKSVSVSLTGTPKHQPQLNKNSLKIASRLEPSIERLTRKRKKPPVQQNAYSFEVRKSQAIASTSSKRCNEMYNQAVDQMKLKKKKYYENLEKQKNEYKQYTFKPKLFKRSNSALDFEKNYLQQTNWKKKIEQQNKVKRDVIENEEIKQCTFSPEINHLGIKNDEKFIMKNVSQMNEYVSRRRESLQKQKELEDLKNKVFFKGNYQVKPTKPKEFAFSKGKKTLLQEQKSLPIYESEDFIDSINILHRKIQNLDL